MMIATALKYFNGLLMLIAEVIMLIIQIIRRIIIQTLRK
jgi:hypothetical protein